MDVAERRLIDAMASAKEALDEMWAADDGLAGALYRVDIPEQHIEVPGRERMQYVLGTLKGAGVRGTYRVISE